MITKEMCIAIYNCHNEIEKAKSFINELETKTLKEIVDALPFYLKDKSSENGFLTLGYTTGSSSRSLCAVSPDLALKIAKEHLARCEDELVDFNNEVKVLTSKQ